MRAMLCSLLIAALAVSAIAAQPPTADDAASAVIGRFDIALLASMHHDGAPLKAALDALFNVPVMAASIVGPNWNGMAQEQRVAVAAALRGYLLARFAHEFDDYGGEQFHIEPLVQTRGPDKLVRTTVTSRTGDATQLYYRLRSYHGSWRIIDVYYDGISQLSTQRADLAAVAGDVPALIAQIQRATSAIR